MDIEKKDFPIGRRGYEPEAVDAHLARVAEELDGLRLQLAAGVSAPAGGTPRPAESMSAAASSQVRVIVEAAETAAAEVRSEAEEDARRTRAAADADARRTREEAGAEAQAHVRRVQEATERMLQRVDAMESELGALVESLRTGANRLTADLALLQGNVGDIQGDGPPVRAAAPAVREVEAPAAPAAPSFDATEDYGDEPGGVMPEPFEEPAAEAEPAADEPAGGGDVEGARLIALNMALNGAPRDETAAYLAENYDLAEADALLDEVYARVG